MNLLNINGIESWSVEQNVNDAGKPQTPENALITHFLRNSANRSVESYMINGRTPCYLLFGRPSIPWDVNSPSYFVNQLPKLRILADNSSRHRSLLVKDMALFH